MKLNYTAFDIAGKQVNATVEATNTVEAREMLRRQGLFVVTLDGGAIAAEQSASRATHRVGSGKRLKYISGFARQMHALISSGTALAQGLIAIERQCEEPQWKRVVTDLRERVERGIGLSEAMKAQPDYFDAVARSLIAAGEASGNVPQMLDRLAVLTRKQLKLRASIVGALIYPCLLCFIGVCVVVMMLLFVLPRFAGLFKTLDTPLPPTTQFLMWLSGMLQLYWWAGLLGSVAVLVIGRFWVRSDGNRQVLGELVLRLPKIGRLARNLMTARISRLLGVLLESRVPLLEALDLTKAATVNGAYFKLMARAEEAVTRGDPISAVLCSSELISPSVQEALRQGEQSGQMGQPLVQMADFLDEENELVIKSVASLLEPAILIVLGILVGFMALSMFLPLFDLVSAAHAT